LGKYLQVQPEIGIGNAQVLMKITDSKHEFFDREKREKIEFQVKILFLEKQLDNWYLIFLAHSYWQRW